VEIGQYRSANYSAHRFLADSYAVLAAARDRRVSELLQSQLLQPLNVNPAQPSLAQKNLSILEGAGPSSQSFQRVQSALPAQPPRAPGQRRRRFAGDLREEVVLSGLQEPVLVQPGQFHFQTDGFREKQRPDARTSITCLRRQAFRRRRASWRSTGRSTVTTGIWSWTSSRTTSSRTYAYSDQYKGGRIGVHHAFAPGSDFHRHGGL